MADSPRDSSAIAFPRACKPEAEAILQELNRIVESPAFRGSERCKHFLQFVVHQAVEGKAENLKERVIGWEIFGRAPDYETAGDAIVRVKANEIRKRLAQYYAESAHCGSVRIDLPTGSYLPRFHWNLAEETKTPLSPVTFVPAKPLEIVRRSQALKGLISILAVVLLVAAIWWIHAPKPSEFDQFWASTLSGTGTPVIYLGTSTTYMIHGPVASQLEEAARSSNPKPVPVMPGDVARMSNYHVPLGNLHAVMQIAAILQSRGKPAELRPGGELKLGDMSGRPVILIGAYSNPWTMQTNARLRFRFRPEGGSIYDSMDSQRVWSMDKRFPWEPQTVDYAIVSRVWDATSGSVFIVAAGLNVFGTQTAGEFLTKPEYWKDLAHRLPAGWTTKNIQVVLQTSVVGTIPSTPKVVSTYVW